MRGYSEEEVFPKVELAYWRKATRLVEAIPEPWILGSGPRAPDRSKPPIIRCHELARAVSFALDEPRLSGVFPGVVDGKYGAVEHSWIKLVNSNGRTKGCVLDVYSVGRLPMVQLVDLSALLPHQALYKEQKLDLREAVNTLLIEKMLAYWKENHF